MKFSKNVIAKFFAVFRNKIIEANSFDIYIW